MTFNVIRINKIPAKISEYTVYTMDHPKSIVYNQKKQFIGTKGVKQYQY